MFVAHLPHNLMQILWNVGMRRQICGNGYLMKTNVGCGNADVIMCLERLLYLFYLFSALDSHARAHKHTRAQTPTHTHVHRHRFRRDCVPLILRIFHFISILFSARVPLSWIASTQLTNSETKAKGTFTDTVNKGRKKYTIKSSSDYREMMKNIDKFKVVWSFNSVLSPAYNIESDIGLCNICDFTFINRYFVHWAKSLDSHPSSVSVLDIFRH